MQSRAKNLCFKFENEQNRERSEPTLRQNASAASHQADNLAKLRHEHLSVLELLAQILGAVSSETS